MAKPLMTSELRFIEGHYGLMTMKEMAAKLGRSYSVVWRTLITLGLHVPGKRGGKRVYAPHSKNSSTWFKKGVNNSPLTYPIGTVVTRKEKGVPYSAIKTPTGWRSHAIVVIEESLGRKLSRSETIFFRDGDRTNCSVDNLDVIKRSDLLNKSMTPEKRRASVAKGNRTRRRNKEAVDMSFKISLAKQPKSLDMTGKMGRMYFGMKFD